MNLQTFKGKQVAAKKGFDLLKSKSDALKVFNCLTICIRIFYKGSSSNKDYPYGAKVRFRDICKVIYATKIGMSDQSSSAFFSLTQAEYAAGELLKTIFLSRL